MSNIWIPEWLGSRFAILYAKFKNKPFTFSQARAELKVNQTNLLKIFSDLGKKGWIYKIKDKYYLTDFDAFCLGIQKQKEWQNLFPQEILKKSGKKYLIAGPYAASLYCSTTKKTIEIEVLPQDYGFFINFDFKIKPILTEKKFKNKILLNNLYLAPPQEVIISSLKQATLDSIFNALQLLTAKKSLKSLNWNELIQLACQSNFVNELGIVLDYLTQLKKTSFYKKYSNELFTHLSKKGRLKIYPHGFRKVDYGPLEKKWKIDFRIPKSLFPKLKTK